MRVSYRQKTQYHGHYSSRRKHSGLIRITHVIHLFWAPESTEAFIQAGHFYLWAESAAQAATKSGKRKTQSHPNHLDAERLRDWLKSSIGIRSRESDFVTCPVPLPSSQGKPLPCPELSTHLNGESYAWNEAEIETWPIRCFCIKNRAINLINEIHFRLIFQGKDFKAGSDLPGHPQTRKRLVIKSVERHASTRWQSLHSTRSQFLFRA